VSARLDRKGLPRKNTLAYYKNLQFTDKKVLLHWALVLYKKGLFFAMLLQSQSKNRGLKRERERERKLVFLVF
jgi:hypothetical protein